MIWNAAAILGVIFAAFVSFIIMMRAHRRRRIWEDRASSPPAFDAVELHAMQVSGELSVEEADRVMAASVRQQNASPSLPAPGPRGFDVLPVDRK